MVAIYLTTLVISCMACHGELARLRPDPRHLTSYYLVIAAGGVVGGSFVTLGAPLLFNDLLEYPLGLAFSCLVIVTLCSRDDLLTRTPRWVLVLFAIFLFLFASLTVKYFFLNNGNAIVVSRNFYGVLKLYLDDDKVGRRLVMVHGQTKHGWQYVEPGKMGYKTAYYGPDSGAGLALRFHPRRFSIDPGQRSLRIGVIGLGAGTLAAYGEPGDLINFYEINREAIAFADRYFSFCRNSAARIGFIEGDARIMLEAELKQNGPRQYDVIVVDAFSSDAIPVHLLTRECFALYRKHLKPDGLIALHLSNKYLDLVPAVRSQGIAAGFLPKLFTSQANEEMGVEEAPWMVLMPNVLFLTRPEVYPKADPPALSGAIPIVWTDDFASLWQAMRLK